MKIERAVVRGASALLVALLVAGCGVEDTPKRGASNILLITVDTLRADHLSAWGYARQTSPVIDALAAEGVRFDKAWAQWPKTGPSFASLFTSTYPKDNGIVRRVGTPLPAGFLMLAETLKRRGYTTHAVVSNGAVGSEFYFNQGFETYIETWKLPREPDGSVNTAEVVNREVRSILDRLDGSKPYFLWVHYLDPHFPYMPPAEFAERFVNDAVYEPIKEIDVAGTRDRQMGGIGPGRVLGGRTDLGYYVALYDAEIAHLDSQLGVFLADMKARGLMENTLTVFTSDHGESIGEHDYYFDHGRFGFETCLHVPLIFHYPGRVAPRVDLAPVELLDVTPTILQFAGVSLPEGRWMQGRSLLPRLQGETREGDGYSRAEAGNATKGRWQKVVRNQQYKLIFAPFSADQRHIGGEGEEYALYDLAADPGELDNLMHREHEAFAELKAELFTWWIPESFDVLIDVGDTREEKEVSEETLEQLKALGYLQ